MRGSDLQVVDLGPLTKREAETLLWVAEGKTAWEVGTILGIAEATATAHANNAAAKLGASNRPHLVARAFIRGILSPLIRALLLGSLLVAACNGTIDENRLVRRPPRRREGYPVEERRA